MADFVAPLQDLVDQFRRLPGIGSKTAVRLAFSVMEFTEELSLSDKISHLSPIWHLTVPITPVT